MENFYKNKQFVCLMLFGPRGSGKKSTVLSLSRKMNFDRQVIIDSKIMDQHNMIYRKIGEDLGLVNEDMDDKEIKN